ncbi:filamentous hemagglutinin N-terminal domain-containing protein, partial [Arcobacteraceae bacterium]|nr:filamentous hemagglutinin N-terminal domain-containing protein [Arcobacteraceae bacterium]
MLSLEISYTLIFLPLYAVDLTPDGTTNTNIAKARNNVPIVNIANPNNTGLSHNKFTNYNVGTVGLILNNSKDTSVNTQLGGFIYGNKNLTSNAKVILNEVTSTNRSSLNGYTEIAGQKADLIIANPNGLSINGAGFINASAVTLTTGSANILNGSLDSLSVHGGTISIGENGLDSTQVDSTYIYTHYLKLNAQINAKNLDIKLGNNKINHSTKEIMSSTNSGDTTNLLLDSSVLGGMYANRITLIGTDKGLGVNLPSEVLASIENITISNDGKIVLQKLSAKNDISVTSLSDDIDVESTIYSSNDINLNSSNTLNNKSDIKAKKTITIKSNKLINNTHTIIAGIEEDNSLNVSGNLIITSNTIDTTHSTLHATNDLSLNVDSLENKDSSIIQAGHDLTINSQGDIINSSSLSSLNDIDITTQTKLSNNGLINASNDLTINSNNLINNRTLFSGNDMKLYTENILTNNEDANIFSINNLAMAKNTANEKTLSIINEKATIETLNKDINIYANALENITDEPIVTTTTHVGNYITYNGYDCSRSGKDCRGHSNDRYSGTKTTMTDQSNTPKKATISAENINLYVDNFINKYSLLSANNNIYTNITTVSNKSLELFTNTSETYSIWGNQNYKSSWGRKRMRQIFRYTRTDSTSTLIGTVFSTIQAGGSITGNISTLSNGNIKENETIASSTQTTQNNNEILSLVNIKKEEVKNVNVELPNDDYGLFVRAKNPNSKYLIETNPEFTIYNNFISSNYVMNKINFNPDITLKRVGDAFYEQRLISKSIFKQTGKAFLDNKVSDNNIQYQNLMDNAILVQTDLELVAGITLSKEQINNLSQDIVWMEEQIIAGEKVLVPVVYIANIDSYKIVGSQIVAAESISLSLDALVNSGTLKAGESIVLNSSNSIENYGGNIEAKNDISLTAKNDISNTSGTIKANNINLTSQEGDIVNKRFTKAVSYGANGIKDDKTLIGKAGNIEATNTLNINTNNTFLNQGSTLTANDIQINAKNVDITTSEDKKDFSASFSGGYVKENSTTNIASNLNANNININSIDTTTIKGSNLNAVNDIQINAKKIDILAVQDTDFKESKTSSKGFLSSKSTTTTDYTLKNKDANLKAKGKITLNTNKDINIVSSTIEGDGGVSATSSEGSVNVVALNDITIHKEKTKKSGLSLKISKDGMSLFKKTEDSFNTEDYISKGSLLSSGSSLNIEAKEDVTLQNIDMNAKEDITLAGTNVNILNTNNRHINEESHSSMELGANFNKNDASLSAELL